MRLRTLLSFAVVAVCTHRAEADPQTERVRAVAEEHSAAFTSGNYARLVDLTYPKLVEMIGGRDEMIRMLRSGAEDMQVHGGSIISATVAEPDEIVTAGDKQFAIVPEVLRVQATQGILRSNGFLVAVSEDRGKTWKFIDGAGLHKTPGREREALAQILPDLPASLALPAWKPPVLESK